MSAKIINTILSLKKILRHPTAAFMRCWGARILNFTKLSSNKQEKKPPERKWNFRN